MNPDEKTIDDLFRKITKERYGKEIDYTSIEKTLGDLKNGGQLTYDHLEKISDPNFWPFYKFWRWPEKEQIEEDLKKTTNLFIHLKNLPSEHEQRTEDEKKIIHYLYYNIFKHIELVSIVLRFIDPDNYGIYSPPVAYYLNTPRGYSYGTEYLNYLEVLRKYKNIYSLKKVAYVDAFFWSLAMPTKDKTILSNKNFIIEAFHRNIKETIRQEGIRRILEEEGFFQKTDLEKAEFYYEVGDYGTAGKWVGCAFTGILSNKYLKYSIDITIIDSRGIKIWKNTIELINILCTRLHKDKDQTRLQEVRSIRNKIMHENYTPSKEQVQFMIDVTKNLATW